MNQAVLTQSASRLRALVDDLRVAGHDVGALLAEAGIREQDLQARDPVLPFTTIVAVFEAAARIADDDLFGFRQGCKASSIAGGVISYAGLSSPTVRELLKNLSRYRRVFSDAVEIDLTRLDSDGIVTWFYAVPAEIGPRQLVEFNAANVIGAIREATGRAIRPERVVFAHPRPATPPEMARYFGCPVAFGAGGNHVQLKPRDLDLPLRTADDGLHHVLISYCEKILAERATAPRSIVADVEREITARLSSGEARQDVVARALGLSRRTLARRLADAGTSFSGVRESLRRALAEQYLTHSDMSVTEIAFLLGYGDAATFSTAFRRWTGRGPRAFRSGAPAPDGAPG